MFDKECRKCKETKSYDEFHNSSSRPDGKNMYCRKCQNAMVEKNELNYKLNGPKIFPDKKFCNMCNLVKPISQFVKNKRRKDGYHHYCKPCWKGYVIRAQRRQDMYNG